MILDLPNRSEFKRTIRITLNKPAKNVFILEPSRKMTLKDMKGITDSMNRVGADCHLKKKGAENLLICTSNEKIKEDIFK